MKTKNEILNEVFNEMPETFSGNQFLKKIRTLSDVKLNINANFYLPFLKSKCKTLPDFPRIYIKKQHGVDVVKRYLENNELALNLALESVPNEFSIYEFCNRLRDFSYDDRKIHNASYLAFLGSRCTNIGSRTWLKNTIKSDNTKLSINAAIAANELHKQPELNESDCINYLKGLGYKIMRSVTNYEEV